jgi:hypothetical protein
MLIASLTANGEVISYDGSFVNADVRSTMECVRLDAAFVCVVGANPKRRPAARIPTCFAQAVVTSPFAS